MQKTRELPVWVIIVSIKAKQASVSGEKGKHLSLAILIDSNL